jgi:hypothetical protein
LSRLIDDLSTVYQRDIVDAGKQTQFIILLAFLFTFCLVRLITHAIRDQRFSFLHDVSRGGTHIHHLVWGIMLLLGTGYAAIAFGTTRYDSLLAVLFGVGAALTLDEFALWLHLEDVYWAKQGRASIDAVIVVASILALSILGWSFWINTGRAIGDGIGRL